MWPWRQSGPNKYPLWFKLLGVTCALHSVVLVLLFVAYRGYYAQYHLDIKRSAGAPIIFMPLHKTAQSIGQKGNGNKQNGAQSVSTVSVEQTVLAKPKAATSIAQDKKRAAQKTNKEKKRAQKKKQQELAKKKQAEALKKKKREEEARKKKEAGKQKQQKLKEKQKEVAKEESKPIEVPQEPQIINSSAQPSSEHVASDVANPDAVYVGQVEWEALQLQEAIQHEVEQHWKPPAGLANDLCCTIKVIIDWHGNIIEVAVEQRSGVLAYDIHARSAIGGMHFPKTAWGKELIINFKQ